MKKSLMIFILIIMLVFPSVLFAQSAKEALTGLKKMEVRCQTGISYHDYSNALAEARFETEMFLESNEAKKHTELSGSLNKALKHYEFAGELLHGKMSGNLGDALHDGLILKKGPYGKEIEKSYPQVPTKKFLWTTYYGFDAALPAIWEAASKELKSAFQLYSKIEHKSLNESSNARKEIEELKKEIMYLKTGKK